MTGFEYVDALIAGYQERGGQPGIAFGVVLDGTLAHAGGTGEYRLGTAVAPGADTVFRIASMTKSFTAAAILLLRDQGALGLDDPAGQYVPQLRGWPPVTADAARITIRHLLTMTAGFPTDDPWGDRQQGLPLDEFDAFLAAGVRRNWAPGTRFEYSNLGYAILGRVISEVTDMPYRDFVTASLLRPLGMHRSGFDPVGDGQAWGYRRGRDGWELVPFDPYGAFAPMGGLYTSVSDLARWVAGLTAAFPPGDGGDAHPLRAASRREMQLPQVATGWERPLTFGAPEGPVAYGFGLTVTEDPAIGRVAGHGGGYPGFGTYMCWHPDTGTGVIALANGTYARMGSLADSVLRAVLARRERPRTAVSLAPVPAPWPETLAAREAVSALLKSWDDGAAERLFSPNVALDMPFGERRQAIAKVRERIGDFTDSGRAPEHDTPAHCRWWLAGHGGTVQVQIQLTPELPPRVQSLTLAVPPAPGSALRVAADALLAALNGAALDVTARGVDLDVLARRIAAARAWAGPCRLTAWTAGNGSTAATAALAGEHAPLTLALAVNPCTGELLEATIRTA